MISPNARAEKIVNECLSKGGICSGPEVLAIIADALKQYAYEHGKAQFDRGVKEGSKDLAQARAEAIEDCAKVADDWENTGMKISTKIRALATPPETEEKR